MPLSELPAEEDDIDKDLTDAELQAANAELDAWVASQDPLAGLDQNQHHQNGEEWIPVIDILQGKEREEFRKRLGDLDGWNKGEVPSI